VPPHRFDYRGAYAMKWLTEDIPLPRWLVIAMTFSIYALAHLMERTR
jgi:hypothetical protein